VASHAIELQRAASSTSSLREPENAPRFRALQYAAREKRPIEKRLTRTAKFGRRRGGVRIAP
jgi:hypothetical protein